MKSSRILARFRTGHILISDCVKLLGSTLSDHWLTARYIVRSQSGRIRVDVSGIRHVDSAVRVVEGGREESYFRQRCKEELECRADREHILPAVGRSHGALYMP